MTNPVAVRLRRGFGLILNLIRAHALRHLASRRRDEHERIVAALEECRAVYALAVELVGEGVWRQR